MKLQMVRIFVKIVFVIKEIARLVQTKVVRYAEII